MTRSVVIQQALAARAHLDSHAVEYAVGDTVFSPAPVLFITLAMITLSERAHAEAYLARLTKIPAALAALAERHRAGIAAGRLPVRRLADAAVAHFDRYLSHPAGDPLRRPTPAVDVPGFADQRDRLLETMVRPAVTAYREVLASEVVPVGRTDDRAGLCWAPPGRTRTPSADPSRSPAQVHQPSARRVHSARPPIPGRTVIQIGSTRRVRRRRTRRTPAIRARPLTARRRTPTYDRTLTLCYPLTQAGRMREVVSMPAAYAQSDQFRGARIHLCDLAGLEIRDCEVSGLKIVDCYGGDVYLGGDFERLVVNDVDVTAYVEAELDRQHPTRVLARDAVSCVDYRAAWDAIETQWEATLDRARLLPEAKLHEQVNGEWSFVETQRHLLMAGDAWLGNAVLEEDAPYHPLGLPYRGMPPDAAAKLGLTLEATPTLDEVLAPRLARMATMRGVVDGLTEAELDRVCGRKPADPYPDREYVVRRCLKVVLKEEAEHHRYAVRDLAVLEAAA